MTGSVLGENQHTKLTPNNSANLHHGRRRYLHRSSRTDWFLAFLEMFPSPHMTSALTKEEFTTAAWEVIGRKVEKSLMLLD